MSRFLITIPAAQRDAANAAAATYFDKAGAGQFTFTVPLYPAGAPNDDAPSHFWCSAEVSEANVPILRAMQAQFPGSTLNEYDADAQPGYPHERLATLGLRTGRATL